MKKVKTTLEILENISEKEPSKWLKNENWENKNQDWLDFSFKIALKVLLILCEKNISQKKLAGLMKVSPQQVNKIIKGHENLTIETIFKLEKAMGVKLISIGNNEKGLLKPAMKQNKISKRKQCYSLPFIINNKPKSLKLQTNYTNKIATYKFTKYKNTKNKYSKIARLHDLNVEIEA